MNIAKNEGCKFAKLGKTEKCFVGNLATLDKDGTEKLSKNILETVAKEFSTRAPNTALVLVTCCNELAQIHTSIPQCITEFTELELLEFLKLPQKCKELQDGEYLKYRDLLINNIFSFFNDKNLINNNESSDECYTFDD